MSMTCFHFQRPAATLGRDVARTAVALMTTLGVAAMCWVIAVQQMPGMDMGAATTLGSFESFAQSWTSMMVAMMLPGAVPALLRRTHSAGVTAAALFAVSYLAVWTAVGTAVYWLCRPHGTVAAGVVMLPAGVYELTPIKGYFRLKCRDGTGSGFVFGLNCVGSSVGLMAMLVGLGIMNVPWMAAITVVVLGQKLLPAKVTIDVPLALALIGLGFAILAAPASIPGLLSAARHMPVR